MAPAFSIPAQESLESLAYWGSILVLKTAAMSFLTAKNRFATKTFANPEDATVKPGGKVSVNENVERIRRAHQNDVENIFLFFAAAGFYLLGGPDPVVANRCFKIFTLARVAHTLVYVNQVPQPTRALSFFAGMVVTLYMAGTTLMKFWS